MFSLRKNTFSGFCVYVCVCRRHADVIPWSRWSSAAWAEQKPAKVHIEQKKKGKKHANEWMRQMWRCRKCTGIFPSILSQASSLLSKENILQPKIEKETCVLAQWTAKEALVGGEVNNLVRLCSSSFLLCTATATFPCCAQPKQRKFSGRWSDRFGWQQWAPLFFFSLI